MSWKLFISHHLKEYLFLPDTLAPKAPEIYCCTFLSIDSFEVFIASVKWCVHCQSLNTTEKKHLDSSLRYKCGTWWGGLSQPSSPSPFASGAQTAMFPTPAEGCLVPKHFWSFETHIPRADFLNTPQTSRFR